MVEKNIKSCILICFDTLIPSTTTINRPNINALSLENSKVYMPTKTQIILHAFIIIMEILLFILAFL